MTLKDAERPVQAQLRLPQLDWLIIAMVGRCNALADVLLPGLGKLDFQKAC